MKLLCIHSDYIEYEAKKKAVKEPEELLKKEDKMEECLTVFMSVEKNDEENPEKIAKKAATEIKKNLEAVKTNKVMLYPYAHLSSDLASPDKAVKIMVLVEKALKENKKLEVKRSPFGWYKSFNISCKGHPLSELSSQIRIENESEKEEKKFIKKDDIFELCKDKLSEKEKIKLSTAMVIAKSLKEINPQIKVGSIGFYHDMAYVDIFGIKLKESDISKIRKKAKYVINRDFRFEKSDIKKLNSKFQKIIANDLGKNAEVYKFDDLIFTSVFSKPFVSSAKKIGAFKITNLASAYWKNNANNEQLERVYCVGFASREELEKYEQAQEEAEKRDHRKLGKEMGLFSFHKEAPGMPFFHDKGSFIYDKLVEYMTSEMKKLKYKINKTPMILNKSLWLQSGHWDHYKENMYFTKIDNQDFAVKPMNCPGNILIYKTDHHSYKELPIKAGEFGIVHRHELSGVLAGLFRVRVFNQDDAHVFCTEKQLKDQIIELLDLVKTIYSTFGFEYSVELSTRPDKAMGDPKLWKKAENALAEALKERKLNYKLNSEDGAFYGPKIDFHIKDTLQRSWQCGTIQLDFQMPEKFELVYEGSDAKKHRPVMLHRAIYGSVERFLGILVEHFAGKFPLWLNPVQVKIITVADRHEKFANKIRVELEKNYFRVEVDSRTETIGKKVRDAQMEKVNYILTIGDKEEEKNCLAIRSRDGKTRFEVLITDFINELREEDYTKAIK